jgi:hypothetical protein
VLQLVLLVSSTVSELKKARDKKEAEEKEKG